MMFNRVVAVTLALLVAACASAPTAVTAEEKPFMQAPPEFVSAYKDAAQSFGSRHRTSHLEYLNICVGTLIDKALDFRSIAGLFRRYPEESAECVGAGDRRRAAVNARRRNYSSPDSSNMYAVLTPSPTASPIPSSVASPIASPTASPVVTSVASPIANTSRPAPPPVASPVVSPAVATAQPPRPNPPIPSW